MKPLHIAIIAGEPSGDRLAGDLVAEIARLTGSRPHLTGVGGDALAGEGLVSLFDYTELSIVGVSAVLAQLPRLLWRIRQTADAIVAAKPDLLIIADSPDFTHRVARRVKARLPDLPVVNYVVPTVWAWKPERASAMRGYVDHALSLFPFEPAVYEALGGPPVTYVGHRLTGDPGLLSARKMQADRARDGRARPRTCLFLPGSRAGEIRKLADPFREAAAELHRLDPDMRFVLPAGARVAALVREAVSSWPVKPQVVEGEAARWQAFGEADCAIAASGTVILELALAGVPVASCYRIDGAAKLIMHKVTAWTAALPNWIAGYPIVPEYINEMLKPVAVARMAHRLAEDTPQRAGQLEGFDLVFERMQTGEAPSAKAARTILDLLHRT